MNELWRQIKSIFLHQTVQILVVIGGLAITLVNVFIASKLAPVATNIAIVAEQTQANTKRLNDDELYIPQFIELKQNVMGQKEQLNRIETRVDSIDNFLRGYK